MNKLAVSSETGSILTLTAFAGMLALSAFSIFVSGNAHAGFGPIQEWLRPGGSLFWSNVTGLGDMRVLLGFAMLLSIRTPQFWIRLLLASAGAALAVKAIRHGFPTHRPEDVLGHAKLVIIGIERTGSSLPSSHAALGWAFASLFVLEYGCLKGLPVLFLATLLALSRIAVGAHWPIDVVTGALIGLIAGYMAWRIGQRHFQEVGKPILSVLTLIGALALLSLPFDAQGYPESLPIRCIATVAGLLAIARKGLRYADDKSALLGAPPSVGS